MEILELNGKHIKISKNSITAKGENGKTCGVVRNITKFYDLQVNKQIVFYGKIKNIPRVREAVRNAVIKDDELYFLRNIKSKKFHEEYGFLNDYEREKAEREEKTYQNLRNAGFVVLECFIE